ncbi:MAG: condensation domain-containing protein, partial [Gemmatimonadaceae bacterium]
MTDTTRRLADLTPAQRAQLQQRLIDAQRNSNRSHTIPHSDADSRAPSSGEERLWFLDQVVGSSALYNVSSALQLTGDVNVDAVRSALRKLVQRHDILRTRYLSDAGALRIVVDSDCDVRLEILNVDDRNALHESTGGSDGGVWTAVGLNTALEAEASRPFALERDMLLRAVLYSLGPRSRVLQLTTHHIASDGWSQELLWHELGEFYNAHVRGADAELPELPIRYGDYANWMRGPAKAAELERAASDWSELLSGSSQVLELPTDHPRQAAQTHRGSLRSYELSSKAVAGLSEFGRGEHATPFMVLLSGLFAVLHRYTGQSRLLVGSPMAARPVPEVKGIIGFFANTVALPGDLSGDPTFRELVAQIRTVALKAYACQDVPFESIVQRMNPERDSSRSPLVQVMLALDNYPSRELKLDGLETALREIHTGTSKFDLTIHAAVSQLVGKATIEFNSDLFAPDTIDRFWLHLNNFLENAMDRPDERISTVQFLGADERRMLLTEWNATAEEYPRFSSVAALVEEQVERTPDAVAVVFGDTRLSYRQLNNRANQLAAELISRGAAHGCAVGLCVERSADMMVALLAIVKTGAAYVPVDPSLPAERANYILSDSGAEFVITQRQLLENLSSFAGAVVLIDADEWKSNHSTNLCTPGSDSLVYIIYTSGSTGKPKGVRVRANALINLLWSMRARFGLDAT